MLHPLGTIIIQQEFHGNPMTHFQDNLTDIFIERGFGSDGRVKVKGAQLIGILYLYIQIYASELKYT